MSDNLEQNGLEESQEMEDLSEEQSKWSLSHTGLATGR